MPPECVVTAAGEPCPGLAVGRLTGRRQRRRLRGVIVSGSGRRQPVAIAGVPFMTSLFARASDDVWAAGADVAHFDGQQWTLVPDVPDVTRTGNTDPGTYVTGDAHSVWLATGGRFFRMVD